MDVRAGVQSGSDRARNTLTYLVPRVSCPVDAEATVTKVDRREPAAKRKRREAKVHDATTRMPKRKYKKNAVVAIGGRAGEPREAPDSPGEDTAHLAGRSVDKLARSEGGKGSGGNGWHPLVLLPPSDLIK